MLLLLLLLLLMDTHAPLFSCFSLASAAALSSACFFQFKSSASSVWIFASRRATSEVDSLFPYSEIIGKESCLLYWP